MIKSKINYEFKFHPIGQGLFYSGTIMNDNKSFTMVFDCGSESPKKKREQVIDNSVVPKHIDLLIVSHFHRDHVNGLEKLMKDRTVGEVVLPFINENEKILHFLHHQMEMSRMGNEDEDLFYEVVSSPERFFENAQKISFLLDNGKGKNTRDYEEYNGWNELPISPPSGYSSTNNKVKFYNHTAILMHEYWVFRFFLKQPSSRSVKSLEKKIKDNGLELGNFKEKYNAYKKIFNSTIKSAERNSTSIVCCHGPRFSIAKKFHQNYIERAWVLEFNGSRAEHHALAYKNESSINPTSFVLPLFQLLTGDAELTTKEKVISHFHEVFSSIMLFQIPHHGSKNNWYHWFTEELVNCRHWVCCYGNQNRHKHPDADFSCTPVIKVTEMGNPHCISGHLCYYIG